jgi:hypothetical protein
MKGMGRLRFWMGWKVAELWIFNQSIHYQVKKFKIAGAWRFSVPGLSLLGGRDKNAYFNLSIRLER